MQSGWSALLGAVKATLPRFNDDVLRNFKRRQLDSLLEQLDAIIPAVICAQFPEIKYVGVVKASPEEAANMLFDDSLYNGLSIERSSIELVKFMFMFDGMEYSMPLWIPYMDPYAILINGTHHYPLFAIMERSMNRIRDPKSKLIQYDGIGTQLAFYPIQVKKRRNDEHLAVDHFGKRTYRTLLVTMRAHHKADKDRYPPLLCYHLANFGLLHTLAYYGFNSRALIFIPNEQLPEVPAPDSCYFEVPHGFIQVNEDLLADPHAANFMLTLHWIFVTFPYRNFEEPLGANENMYYQIVLGRMVTTESDKVVNMRSQAVYHLAAIYLDPVSQRRFATEGIVVADVYDLFRYIYHNLHTWIENYQPSDVFNKRIVLAEVLLYRFMKKLNGRTFATKKKTTGKVLRQKDVSGLLRVPPRTLLTQITSDMTQDDKIFSSSIMTYNDNYLFTIGCTKVRAHKSKTSAAKGKGARAVLMKEYYSAHPSQLVCESPLDYPASNPTVSGSIGGFIEIDENGLIIKPVWASEIDNIYT